MKHWLAHLILIVANRLIELSVSLSPDAYEENFDGTRPFGKAD